MFLLKVWKQCRYTNFLTLLGHHPQDRTVQHPGSACRDTFDLNHKPYVKKIHHGTLPYKHGEFFVIFKHFGISTYLDSDQVS